MYALERKCWNNLPITGPRDYFFPSNLPHHYAQGQGPVGVSRVMKETCSWVH